jgi:uncharacterized protein (DUF362 family)
MRGTRMNRQLSLFNSHTDSQYWEHTVINGVLYTLLDVVYPKEADYSSYFQKYFETNVDAFIKLLAAKEIWIKPNITSNEKWERGKTSNPYVLSALLDFLKKYHGEKYIFVADSSVVGCDTGKAAEECGILSVCNDNRITFVDIKELNYRKITVKNSLVSRHY